MSFNTSKVEKGGTLYASGTGADNRVAIWSGTGTLEGDSDLVFDGTSLGIGTTPSTLLHLKATDPVIRLEDSSPDGVYAHIDGAGGDLILGANYGDEAGVDGAIKLSVDNVIKATVDGTGVGIGTTNPSYALHVASNAGYLAYFQNTSTTDYRPIGFTDDQNIMRGTIGVNTTTNEFGLGDATGVSMTLNGGNVGIGGTPTRPLHVFSANSAAISTACLENTSTGDASIWFKESSSEWAVGLDNSDSNSFKISNSSELGSNDRLSITTAGIATFVNNINISSASYGYQIAGTRVLGYTGGNTILSDLGGGVSINTNSVDRLHITNAGLVGIGRTPTTQKLEVEGNGYFSTASGGELTITNSGASGVTLQQTNGGATDSGTLKLRGGSTVSFTTNDVDDRMTIDSAGLVGIDKPSPSAKLHVQGVSSGAGIRVEDTGVTDGIYFFENGTQRGVIGYGDDGSVVSGATADSMTLRAEAALHFATGGNNLRATIDSAGLVGIGTAAPSKRLHVVGAGGDAILVDNKITGAGANLILDTASTGAISLREGGTARMTIDSTGVGIGKTPSTVVDIADDGTGLRLSRGTVDLRLSDNTTNANVGTESNHNLYIRTNSTNRIAVTNAGDVGVGTDSPPEVLTLNSASNTKLLLQEGGANKGTITAGGGGLYITNLAGKINFRNSSDAATLEIEDSGRVTVKKSSNSEIVDQASGTCDLSASNNYQVTIGGATTINLTSGTDGQSGVIKIVHDGSNVPTFTASQIKWAGGTDPTPNTASGDIDVIAYHVDGDIYGVYHNGMAY